MHVFKSLNICYSCFYLFCHNDNWCYLYLVCGQLQCLSEERIAKNKPIQIPQNSRIFYVFKSWFNLMCGYSKKKFWQVVTLFYSSSMFSIIEIPVHMKLHDCLPNFLLTIFETNEFWMSNPSQNVENNKLF